MKAYQIFAIFLVLCHAPSNFGRNAQDLLALEEQIRNSSSPQKQVLIYAFDQLKLLASEYMASSAEICRNILKDEAFAANAEPEEENFKNDVKNFLDKYDNSNKDVQSVWNLIEVYTHIILRHLKRPDEKKISDILDKYGCENNNNEYVKKFHMFADEFIKKSEESMEHMDKNFLEWLEKFKTLTKFDERFGTIMEYLIVMG